MPILGIIASSKLGATSSYESIASVTVGAGGSSTIDFTSIPSSYNHLQIRGIGTTTSSPSQLIRFNSDSGSNYSHHYLAGDGASPSAGGGANADSIFINYGSTTSGTFSPSITDIIDYADTSKYKTTKSLSGYDANGSGLILMYSGNWRNTAAITSITIFTPGGDFRQYSTFALYGIKGA